MTVRGPRDVFLKHSVNPNEFQVPYCPSPILLSCKNVGLSFVQSCYYKSRCPVAFASSCGIDFSQSQITGPVVEFRSRLK